MSNFREQLKRAMERVKLTPQEKADMKSALLSRMHAKVVTEDVALRLIKSDQAIVSPYSFLIRSRIMALGIIIALILSTGTTFAAEDAVPGDILYPVKLSVNENVRGALALSLEDKAQWQNRVMERRLEEAEKLAASGELNAEVRAELETKIAAHKEKAREQRELIAAEAGAEASAELDDDFDSSREAHARVLQKIAQKRGDSEVRAIVAILAADDRKAAAPAFAMRAELAMDSTSPAAGTMEATTTFEANTTSGRAEGKITAVKNKIEETERFIENKKDSLSAEARAEAEAKLTAARISLTQAETKFAADDFSGSLESSTEAFARARDAKVVAQTSFKEENILRTHKIEARLKGEKETRIKFDFRGNSERNEDKEKRDRGTSTDTEAAVENSLEDNDSDEHRKGTDDETEIEVEGEATTSTGNSGVNTETRGRIKIDLGL